MTKLEEMNKTIHTINNKLTAISGFVQLLKSSILDKEEKRIKLDYIKKVEISLYEISTLIKQSVEKVN